MYGSTSITNPPFLRIEKTPDFFHFFGRFKEGSAKKRLIVDNFSTYVALSENPMKVGVLERLLSVPVLLKKSNGANEIIFANRMSLSIRTKLPWYKVFLPGSLTVEEVRVGAEKAQKSSDANENAFILETLKKEVLKEDFREVKQVADSAALVYERLVVVETKQKIPILVFFDPSFPNYFTMQAWKIDQVIAEGGFSGVCSVKNIGRRFREDFVIKLAAPTSTSLNHRNFAQLAIENEWKILKELQQIPGVVGIQKAPYRVFEFTEDHEKMKGYLTHKYDYDLSELVQDSQRKGMNGKELLRMCHFLLRGLDFLHKQGYVHSDIKPQNLCKQEGQFRIADFGDVRKAEQIERRNILSTHTPIYTSNSDMSFARNLSMQFVFCSDSAALDEDKTDLVCFCQKHDVYSLGLCLSEIFEGVSFEDTLRNDLDELINKMTIDQFSYRIGSEQALFEYEKILQQL